MPLSSSSDKESNIATLSCGHALHVHCLGNLKEQFVEECPRCEELELAKPIPSPPGPDDTVPDLEAPDQEETLPWGAATETGTATEGTPKAAAPATPKAEEGQNRITEATSWRCRGSWGCWRTEACSGSSERCFFFCRFPSSRPATGSSHCELQLLQHQAPSECHEDRRSWRVKEVQVQDVREGGHCVALNGSLWCVSWCILVCA